VRYRPIKSAKSVSFLNFCLDNSCQNQNPLVNASRLKILLLYVNAKYLHAIGPNHVT